MRKVNVSCVQMKPILADYDGNIDRMVEFFNQIMDQRPETDLIVYPELITSGYECEKSQFRQFAESVESGGKSIDLFKKLCKERNVTVVYGFPEKDPTLTDVLFNSAIVIGSDGEVMGSYRKTHPFAAEILWCRPGSDFPIFETPFGKIGVMICWDTAFPEVSRIYAIKGADLLVVSTNWEKPYTDDWDLMTKARAFDNTLHLVASNRIGEDKELGWFGRSKIIDPLGKEIEALDEEIEGVIHAQLDLGITEKLRSEYYTFFKDRQPAIYSDIIREYR
jgi:omega-amidase